MARPELSHGVTRSARPRRMLPGLVVTCFALFVSVPGAFAAEPIKIGALLPYSGVFAALGVEIADALDLGFDTFGREVGGREIVVIREDTEGKPNVGLSKAKKLVLRDGVEFLVGPVSSAVAGALRDYVHASQVPLIIANAGNNHLTGESCSPYVIRVSFSNAQINRDMGSWMVSKGFKRVFLMAADYAAGRQMMEAFRTSFVAAGGTVAGEEYAPLSTKDFGPYLGKLKAARPEAAYVFFPGAAAMAFVPQYEGFGLKETIQLAGAGWLSSAFNIERQGAAAAGFIGALNYVPSIDSPENIAFQEAFRARFGRVGSEFAVQGYDSARLIVEALKLTGGSTEGITEAMHQVSFVGPRGELRIDPLTNNVIQDIYVFETRSVGERIEQVVIDRFADVRDPPNGCRL